MGQHWDVIVVGGGLAGLAAGVTATAGGARTLVLEQRCGRSGHAPMPRALRFQPRGPRPHLGGAGSRSLSELGVRRRGQTTACPLQGAPRWRTPCAADRPQRCSAPRCSEPGARPSSAGSSPACRTSMPRAHGHLHAGVLDDLDLRADVRAGCASARADYDLQWRVGGAVGRVRCFGQLQNGVGGRGALCGWRVLLDRGGSRRQDATCVARPASWRRPGHDCVELETGEGRWAGRRVILAPGDPAATLALLPDGPDGETSAVQ